MTEKFNKYEPFKTKEPDKKQYDRFLKYGLNFGDNYLVKYDFKTMMQLFGNSYVYWLELQYKLWIDDANTLTFPDLCEFNGKVPPKFFDQFCKLT